MTKAKRKELEQQEKILTKAVQMWSRRTGEARIAMEASNQLADENYEELRKVWRKLGRDIPERRLKE